MTVEVSAEQAVLMVGISWSQWIYRVKAGAITPVRCPTNTRGEDQIYSRRAVFLKEDVVALNGCFKKNDLESGVFEVPPDEDDDDSIEELSHLTPWPEGLPKDNDTFFKSYGDYIVRCVHHHNKVLSNQEDLEQEIYLRLVKNDVLRKFASKVWRKTNISALEACDYLGVQWPQFEQMVRDRLEGRSGLPEPVYGPRDSITGEIDPLSKECLYRFIHIRDLDLSGYFQERPNPRVPLRVPPSTGFLSYLKTTIHHNWANYCRTTYRRHKERPQDEDEDGNSWASRLAAPDQSVDVSVDYKRIVEELGGNDLSEEEVFSRLKIAASLVGKGCTRRVAIREAKSRRVYRRAS